MMMKVKKLNIQIETGIDFHISLTITDENDEPVNLSGCTVEAHLRQLAESPEYIPFSVYHNGTGGRINLIMVHELTSRIAFAKGVYDVMVTTPDGIRFCPVYGEVYVHPGTTRPFEGQTMAVLAVASTENLPTIGDINRLYYDIQDDVIYRWNGQGYAPLTGPEGPQGEKGDPGSPGPQGERGLQGESGEAASVSVGTVTTLPAGSAATVVNSGTETDAVFDFGIPRGDPGAGSDTDWGDIGGDLEDQTDLQNALDGKSDTTHNHDSDYAALGHNHDTAYSAIGHKHDSDYAAIGHNHDSSYSAINHNHDTSYAPLSHNHDGRYYTEGETDALLSNKSDSNHNHDASYSAIGHNHDTAYAALSHNHDDRYYTESEVDDELEKRDILYFTGQTVSVASSAQIMRIPATGTDSRISTDTVVLGCNFSNPNRITSDITWTSYAGYVAFSGTCKAATRANVTLGTKAN